MGLKLNPWEGLSGELKPSSGLATISEWSLISVSLMYISLLLWLLPSLLMDECVRGGCCEDMWLEANGCSWCMDRVEEEEEEVDEGEPIASDTGWNKNPCLLAGIRPVTAAPPILLTVWGECGEWPPPDTERDVMPPMGDLCIWTIREPMLLVQDTGCSVLLPSTSKLLLDMLRRENKLPNYLHWQLQNCKQKIVFFNYP